MIYTVQIDEDGCPSSEQGKELDRRYEEFLKNPENGRPWNEVIEEINECKDQI